VAAAEATELDGRPLVDRRRTTQRKPTVALPSLNHSNRYELPIYILTYILTALHFDVSAVNTLMWFNIIIIIIIIIIKHI